VEWTRIFAHGHRGKGTQKVTELFTMLTRAGASQMITYASASLAEALG
jgi:delta-aminolevulinic acid dehydratase/porphobilinogen synthase